MIFGFIMPLGWLFSVLVRLGDLHYNLVANLFVLQLVHGVFDKNNVILFETVCLKDLRSRPDGSLAYLLVGIELVVVPTLTLPPSFPKALPVLAKEVSSLP